MIQEGMNYLQTQHTELSEISANIFNNIPNEDYIKLIFIDDNECVVNKFIPLSIITNNPQWCLSTMISDFDTNKDEKLSVLSMKDVMSLDTFNIVSQYFSSNNLWDLNLNSLILMCKQELITSKSCNEIFTTTNSANLTLACQVLELELNNTCFQLQCYSVNHYLNSCKYLINDCIQDNVIVTYQRITYTHKDLNSKVELLFINCIPVLKDYDINLNLYDKLSKETHSSGCNKNDPISINLEYLLPKSFDMYRLHNNMELLNNDNYYCPRKLADNEEIWSNVSYLCDSEDSINKQKKYSGKYINRGRDRDYKNTKCCSKGVSGPPGKDGRRGVDGPPGVGGYDDRKEHRGPRNRAYISRPLKLIRLYQSNIDYYIKLIKHNRKRISELKYNTDLPIMKLDTSSKNCIEIYCGYIKLEQI